MHKRAQAHHTFVYVFSTIAAGLVILFGYYAIKELSNLKEESMMIEFRAELLQNLKTIKPDQVEVVKFDMPSNIKEVCFVGLEDIIRNKIISAGLKARHPLIADAIQKDVNSRNIKGENFFLINDKKAIELSEYVGNVKLDGPNWYCKPMDNSRMELRIEGKEDGFTFAEFELREVIKPNVQTPPLSFDNVIKGLELRVPIQSQGGEITFEITPSDKGISDKFRIGPDRKDWAPELELFYPLECKDRSPLNCCLSLVFNFGGKRLKAGNPNHNGVVIAAQGCKPQDLAKNPPVARFLIAET